MKCLKSTKTGKIIRVSDKEAYNATSEWKFISKSEWKEATRKPKVESEITESTEVVEPIKSKKQLKKQKSDK